MERFKACEKESKIKGINRVYNDPKEKAKDEAREWINTTVDAITSKVNKNPCMCTCMSSAC
jgi:CCR4-NOT transcription complex subunit 3